MTEDIDGVLEEAKRLGFISAREYSSVDQTEYKKARLEFFKLRSDYFGAQYAQIVKTYYDEQKRYRDAQG